jgi:hypothetical protein
MQTFQSLRIDGRTVYRMQHGTVSRVRENAARAAGDYEDRILRSLIEIRRHLTGRILLGEIDYVSRRTGHVITIVPWTGTDNAIGGRDARPAPGHAPLTPDENQVMATQTAPAGQPVYSGRGIIAQYEHDNPLTPQVEHPGDTVTGLGGGTDGMVLFDPATIRRYFTGAAPDDALFHELIHAKHAMEGRVQHSPTHDAYDTQEEFIAVLATDIFLSDKGAFVLRGSHRLPGGRGVLGAMGGTEHAIFDSTRMADALGVGNGVMPESMEFARRHYPHLFGFFVTDQRLAERLASEARAVRFNPLRDHQAGAMPQGPAPSGH